MKGRLNIIVLLASVILSSGCNERYHVTTKINADGSCQRIISMVSSDSSSDFLNPFPVRFDNSWKEEIRALKDTSRNFRHSYIKTFNNLESLNSAFNSQPDTSVISIKVNAEKKFRWFFTYFEYRETYSAKSPVRLIAPDSFFTKKELTQLKSSSTDEALEKRVSDWFDSSLMEHIYSLAEKYFKERHDTDFTPEWLQKNRSIIISDLKENGKSEATLKLLNSPAAKEVEDKIDEEMKPIMEKIKDIDKDYTNEIHLPGLIIDSNSKEVVGNSIRWKLTLRRMMAGSFNMYAEARVVNMWAFVLTIAAVVLVLSGLILPGVIRRRNKY